MGTVLGIWMSAACGRSIGVFDWAILHLILLDDTYHCVVCGSLELHDSSTVAEKPTLFLQSFRK